MRSAVQRLLFRVHVSGRRPPVHTYEYDERINAQGVPHCTGEAVHGISQALVSAPQCGDLCVLVGSTHVPLVARACYIEVFSSVVYADADTPMFFQAQANTHV